MVSITTSCDAHGGKKARVAAGGSKATAGNVHVIRPTEKEWMLGKVLAPWSREEYVIRFSPAR